MELGDQAGQHELIAENFNSLMAQELSIIVKQLKDDRRKVRSFTFYISSRGVTKGARAPGAEFEGVANLAKKRKKNCKTRAPDKYLCCVPISIT